MPGVIALLYLFPALGLIFLLLLRRYPGERTLLRLGRSARPERSTAAPVPATRRATYRLLPRGGLLIASSLAVRPPPVPRLSIA